MKTFEELGVSPEIRKAIEELGYENPMPVQEEVKALKEKIHRIINSLTPRQKEIIYLRFLHQKEYEEIAQIMDMSEQAARNLTYRAMEKIRKENNDFFVLLFMIALFSDYHF